MPGGCCSLVALLLIFIVFLSEISSVFLEFNFDQTSTVRFMDYSDDPEVFTISTEDVIPAFQLSSQQHNNNTLNIEDYVTPSVQVNTKVLAPNGTFYFELKSFKTSLCSESYPEDAYPNINAQFKNVVNPEVYASTEWFCFQPGTFDIIGDPWIYQTGTVQGFSVGYCSLVSEQLGIDSSHCITDQTALADVISGLMVQTKVINKYFDPEGYTLNGNKLEYKTASGFVSAFSTEPKMLPTIQMLLEKREVSYWSGTILQMSSFPQFFSPIEEVWYHPFLKQIVSLPFSQEYLDMQGLLVITFGQSKEVIKNEYTRYTFDASIALLGGYAALFWQVLAGLLSWFQNFSYSNELSKALFTREKRPRSNNSRVDDVTEAETVVLNREPHDYCGYRYIASLLMPLCYCCCSGRQWYRERQQNAKMNAKIQDGLNQQMDIITILRWFRIFKFVSIVTLRKNQAQLVKYFQAYCLQASEDAKIEDRIDEKDLSLEDLMDDFSPQDDRIDKIMLYLLTGRNTDDIMSDWLDPDDGAQDGGQEAMKTTIQDDDNDETLL